MHGYNFIDCECMLGIQYSDCECMLGIQYSMEGVG